MDLISVLKIIEILLAVFLTVFIAIQKKDGDVGTLFGGGFSDKVERTKRGFDLFLHNSIVVMTIFFVMIALTLVFLDV